MAIPYPAICPRSRRLNPGKYATKTFTAINGASSSRLYGDRAFEASLSLEYNCYDNQGAALIQCFHSSYGGFLPLELPAEVWAGMGNDLKAQVPSYLAWKFASEPQVETLFPGRSKITVELIGRLE